MELDELYNVWELEPLARARMPRPVYEYVTGGASDEVTARDNVAAFSRYRLRPRVLVNVSEVDPSTTVLGRRVALPIALAPCGWQQMMHRDGELATARAASAAGVLMCLSTASTYPLEDVAQANGTAPRWFQLYVNSNRDLVRNLLERAADSGFSAIVVTADLPVLGYREREFRVEPEIDDAIEPANFRGFAGDRPLTDFMDKLADPALTWDDLGWIREASGLPVIVKGVLTAEDARLAVDHGAAGVVVSNHGGRQLDRTPASIDVLAEVVAAVGGAIEVYLDGGVRRAADALVALALGARAVFVGRPYLWGLGAAGEAGVARVIEMLRAELCSAMGLLGVTTPAAVTRDHVRAAAPS